MSKLSGRIDALEPVRVCIIKPSSLGDIVHTLPILAALRSRWPCAHLAWVVRQPFHELLEGHALLDELIVYDRRCSAIDFSAVGRTASLLHRLSRGRFDLAIDLQGLLRLRFDGLRDRRRGSRGICRCTRGCATGLYTHVVDAPRREIHAVERGMRVAGTLGAKVSEPRFDVPVTEADRSWVRRMLESLPSPRLLLDVGTRWPTKRWPASALRRNRKAPSQNLERAWSPSGRAMIGRSSTRWLYTSRPIHCSISAARPGCSSLRRSPRNRT